MIKSQKLFQPTFRSLRVSLFVVLTIAVALGLLRTRIIVQPVQAISPNIVISQVYGGAGCGTAGCSTYKNDYIELFNRSASSVSLNGWSVQYAAATGTAWQVTNLTNVSLAPGQYYLVGESAGANGVNNIPTADATGTIAMSATAAKVAVVNTTTALSGACPSGASIIDLIGYGATANCSETAVAPAPSTTTADVRGAAGCTDTDNNSTDFTATTPNPRNTATALSTCGGGTTLSINNVTQAEGNAGTSNFTFTVSLSAAAPAGGVTFDIATANGTTNPASAGSDYVAKSLTSQTIAAGNSSYLFDVVVNGDTTPESNETFFVNVTNVVGATPSSVQGLGTITNDEITLTPIHTIQGSGNSSPLSGSVTTSGIITGLRSNGFFIQEPDATVDADPNTSEGIFVFTSSAPPATAVIGNSVQVTGTISEFIPAADPSSPPVTELTAPTVNLISSGNPLPSFHTITAAETLVNDLNNLEKFEGMRVRVDSLTVIAPTQGTVSEANATSTSNGVFYGVITGVARPFREAGIEVPDPIPTPTPNPNNIPRWDFNPERLRVDSDAQPGSAALEVSTGEVITSLTGPLDYGFRTYTILPDAATPPGTSGVGSAVSVPVPLSRELTIATFNLERFFDTTDNPGISDVALTVTAFNNRLNKASLAIRNFMQTPDVIGIEEMENLTTLQAVANKVNSDAVAASQPNPNYVAYLVEGNDVGGIDVGFLVKSARIGVVSVTQLELAGCDHVTATTCNNYTEPGGALAILNDRPPLVLQANVVMPNGVTLPFTVIVVHQRSLSNIDDLVDGNRVRTKRRAQAEFLANYIQGRQIGDPLENLISVGDYNAFDVNDGYVDVMGTVRGQPAPVDQVLLASSDLVNPNLTDLGGLNPGSYSYTFDGDAQSLDHMLVNNNLLGRYTRYAPAHIDADFPESFRGDPNRPEKISDHDPEVAYFALAVAPTATSGTISGRIRDTNGVPLAGAVVNLSGTQNRKMITDANGNYSFAEVETTGFYTVRATRANYSFSPQERSFSQLSNQTEATFTATASSATSNPVDTAEYFVRQHYLDFLGREPEESGFNFWSDQILGCGSDAACAEVKRSNVSAAYFLSIEFQETGGLVDGLYRASFARAPNYAEFMPDSATIGKDVIVGRAGWEQQLNTNRQAFLEAFVQRPGFQSAYAGLSNEQYVEQLLTHTRIIWTQAEREALVNGLASGTQTRAAVLGKIAGDQRFVTAKQNQMFVMMEYFGYLRRDPDAAGYEFWLNKLNQFNGNFVQAEMVKAFIVSAEYRDRFSR